MNEIETLKSAYMNLMGKTIYRCENKPTKVIIDYVNIPNTLIGKFPIYKHEWVVVEHKIGISPDPDLIKSIICGNLCFMGRKEADDYINEINV